MAKYISKDALVAEIEKLIDEIYAGQPFDSLSRGQQTALWYIKSIMSSINTLEVKEVPEWKRATEDKLIGCLVWDEQRHFHLYNDRVFKGELYISMGDVLELPNSPIKNKYDRQRKNS